MQEKTGCEQIAVKLARKFQCETCSHCQQARFPESLCFYFVKPTTASSAGPRLARRTAARRSRCCSDMCGRRYALTSLSENPGTCKCLPWSTAASVGRIDLQGGPKALRNATHLTHHLRSTWLVMSFAANLVDLRRRATLQPTVTADTTNSSVSCISANSTSLVSLNCRTRTTKSFAYCWYPLDLRRHLQLAIDSDPTLAPECPLTSFWMPRRGTMRVSSSVVCVRVVAGTTIWLGRDWRGTC